MKINTTTVNSINLTQKYSQPLRDMLHDKSTPYNYSRYETNLTVTVCNYFRELQLQVVIVTNGSIYSSCRTTFKLIVQTM